MKIALQGGLEVDVMTSDDLRQELDARERRRNVVIRMTDGASKATDANGNLTMGMGNAAKVPVGKKLRIFRLIVWADGYNPSNGFQASTAWLGIFDNRALGYQGLKDYAPSSPGGVMLPCAVTYGTQNAPEFKPGSEAILGMFNGPASTNVSVFWEGNLYPVEMPEYML